ncbi:hypothetical protein ACWGAN_07080 [Streptomyces sp. NPDC054945]
MDKARLYQHGTVGKKVFAREIDDEPWWRSQKVPLVCPFCITSVVSQRTTVGRAPRGALFRLAADRQHEDVCPLNPTEVLQKIAHGSQGVAVIKGDELHLVLPDDMSRIGATTPIVDTGPAAGNHFGVDVSTVRPLLPPLINSAVVIARFLQKHGFDADVVAQFKVRRPGENKAVRWGEFCHGPAAIDQTRLYARLTSGPKPTHPVAVYGRVVAVENDSQDRPVLRLADGSGFTVRIRSQHPSLLSPARCRYLRPGRRRLEGLDPSQRQARAAAVRRGALAARPLDLRRRHRPKRPAPLPAAALSRPARPPPGPRSGSRTQACGTD